MNSPEKPDLVPQGHEPPSKNKTGSEMEGAVQVLLLRLMPERRTAMMNMPRINMAATGQNIVRLREEAGLSVKELQDIFGFTTPQAIYKWQHGASMPSIDNLVVLAVVFHVTLEEILVLDEGKEAEVTIHFTL